MITGKNYIGNTPSSLGEKVLKAYNPTDGSAFSEEFSVATSEEVNAAIQKADEAFSVYKTISYEQRATFLEAIASDEA